MNQQWVKTIKDKGLCELVRILDELHNKTKNTMITVTHDMRCAKALCDRAILISDGVVQEEGSKELVCKYFKKEDLK
ncbi:MAG: hypothetical protein NC310_05825 [Roseburia sp.]|nr:hypothetical protein [Anaeroplasma bactoclasticum]MCM1196568.1 hypothetical protein [Roseburia sp.]MCM1557601.1 hypothetical protein [Anaeroplasma bactoclasticum]